MAIETDADRLLFVNPEEFGAVAVWTTVSGAKPAVSCIYDDSFIALAAGELEFTQEGGRLQLTMRTSDVPADADLKDAISVTSDAIGAKSVRVLEFQPDGTGMTIVRVQEV
ncbi:hypothetical protein ACLJYM_14465 [Rhizobium giardinii]|uniref:head-tail joining protein n=1 Tax=Rhizobium giardinii TaxID=56731 RepID=UPI0039E186CF